MVKTFKEELYEAAIKSHIMPVQCECNYEENGMISGINADGKLIIITGRKLNGEETKIVISELCDVVNGAPENLTEESVLELGVAIAKKLRED